MRFFYPGSPGGIDINLVGQRLGVSGDKTTFMTEVKTTWGSFYSEQEFFVLYQDGEDLVLGELGNRFIIVIVDNFSKLVGLTKQDFQGVRSRASSMGINFRGS